MQECRAQERGPIAKPPVDACRCDARCGSDPRNGRALEAVPFQGCNRRVKQPSERLAATVLLRGQRIAFHGCSIPKSLTKCECDITFAFMPDTALIPRALLFGNPEKARPRISPDGTMLAYLAPSDDPIVGLADGANPNAQGTVARRQVREHRPVRGDSWPR